MTTEPAPITTIGVVSDTHHPECGALPPSLLTGLENVDVIFHLGDFCNLQTYKEFQKIAPVVAVYGNMDNPELKALLPEKKTLEIQGYTLGLIHGWGPPKKLEERVVQKIKDADIILFGHSHIPLFTQINDVWVFNPGSPTMNMVGAGTYGLLRLGENTLEHEIIRLA